MPETLTPVSEMTREQIQAAIDARKDNGRLLHHHKSHYGKELREALNAMDIERGQDPLAKAIAKPVQAKPDHGKITPRNEFLHQAMIARAGLDLSAFSKGGVGDVLISCGDLYAAYLFGCGKPWEEVQQEKEHFKALYESWEENLAGNKVDPAKFLQADRGIVNPAASDPTLIPNPDSEFSAQEPDEDKFWGEAPTGG